MDEYLTDDQIEELLEEFEHTVYTNMNNTEFNDLVQTAFKEHKEGSFLKKTRIVDTDEDNVPKSTHQFIAADTLDGDADTKGTFEFVPATFPNIKCGVILKLRDDGNNPERFKQTAKNLAIACHDRLNALLALFVYGKGEMGSFYLMADVPEEVHSTISHHKNIIPAINERLQYMKDIHGVTYDRITLHGVTLTLATGKLKVSEAKKALKDATGLKVDVDSSYYNKRASLEDKLQQIPFVPINKIILSNSKNDKKDKFYFANLPVEGVDGESNYGVVGYIKDNIAWAVLRGIPVVQDNTAYSTITINNEQEES